MTRGTVGACSTGGKADGATVGDAHRATCRCDFNAAQTVVVAA